jgi:hypothetical protein
MHAQMGGVVHAPVGTMSHPAPAGSRASGGGGRGGSDRRH